MQSIFLFPRYNANTQKLDTMFSVKQLMLDSLKADFSME